MPVAVILYVFEVQSVDFTPGSWRSQHGGFEHGAVTFYRNEQNLNASSW
jgi:hypothetical protein